MKALQLRVRGSLIMASWHGTLVLVILIFMHPYLILSTVPTHRARADLPIFGVKIEHLNMNIFFHLHHLKNNEKSGAELYGDARAKSS